MWSTALYHPGVLLLLIPIELMGIEIDHFIFKSVILFLWLIAAYVLIRSLYGKSWYTFFTVLAMLLHPYFIWTGLMSKDSAAEYLFLFLSYLVLMKLYSSRIRGIAINTLIVAGIFLLLSLTSLIRVQNFFIVYALLGGLLIVSQERVKRYYYSILLSAMVLFTLLFCFYNYTQSGSFSLSTNMGINILIGNHKAYLHGHPKYDIDTFFKVESIDKTLPEITHLTEAQRNRHP